MPVPDSRFIHGLELFDEGDYFECHEVIEALWLRTASDDPYRDLYKGVIQAAAALYQYDRGILTGARGLFRSSVDTLAKYEPRAMGLNVRKLTDEMKACFADFLTWDGEDPLTLPLTLVPVLDYEGKR